MSNDETTDYLELATDLTIAWLANPNTRTDAEGAQSFLNAMRGAFEATTDNVTLPATEEYIGAVSSRKSLASREHIISMIDGKPYRTLTRHLTTHGLNAAQYRERYGLKSDYPMTAPAYSEQRREMAKKIGLGRKKQRPGSKRATSAKSAAVD